MPLFSLRSPRCSRSAFRGGPSCLSFDFPIVMRYLTVPLDYAMIRIIDEVDMDDGVDAVDDSWDVSLYDLFDISPEPQPAPIEEGEPEVLRTPSISPVPSPAILTPPLTPESVPEMDLSCYEDMPPSSEDESEPIVLDYPEVPGQQCSSCNQFRDRLGDPYVLCSLCYMRRISTFVYSKYGAGI
ncbi:E1A [Polar bear adenovirus 1]|uniref:E1A n=1 Tax=Polar bear adenovirus 1 TaxID=2250215 RepID=A0A2Z4QIZ4_9ADEN|nr:E1A [Polar bear adenovirus 1]